MSSATQVDDFPYYLLEGADITIHHATYGTLYATVVRPFRPRTAMQLVLARLTRAAHLCPLPVGLLFVVKVHDSRFIPDRSPKTDDIPWSAKSERRGWKMYQRDPLTTTPTTTPDPKCVRPDEVDESHVWESFYLRMMATSFMSERAVYHRLSSLQGTALPICYGDGVIDLSRTTPPRAFNPPVILLEYIPDAVTLRDIDPRLLTEPLMQSMLNIADHINDSGILLTDINPGNFMFAPADRPTRAIALDFADALLRDPNEDDQSWNESLSMEGARRTVKLWMRLRFEKMGLPVPPIVQKQIN